MTTRGPCVGGYTSFPTKLHFYPQPLQLAVGCRMLPVMTWDAHPL